MSSDAVMRLRAGGLMVLLACALLLGVSACGKKIGDDCTYNTDCDSQGRRVCDVSQPDGYCTVEGCDMQNNRCPEEAACIRFFSPLDVQKPCAPEHEAVCRDHTPGCDPADGNCCLCEADEECISEGFCIRRELERRNCMVTCGSASDCRGGYMCYTTGVGGAELIPNDDGSPRPPLRYCAPQR
jgi:hypothetical protein